MFLDCSGDSEEESNYDRYWHGYVKTSPTHFMATLENINKSKEFKLLEIKTFYSLKSKFYPKKAA